jgi:hypothetical protein
VAVGSGDYASFKLVPLPLDGATEGVNAVLNSFGWHLVAHQRMPGFGSGTPYPMASGGACVRGRLDDDGTFTCLERAGGRGSMMGTSWLDGGWFTADDWVSHVDWGGRKITLGTNCHERARRASAPRVLVTCHHSPTAFLWAPGKIYTFPGPNDANSIGGLAGADSGEVLPVGEGTLGGTGPDQELVRRWVDLAGLHVYSTPKLRPLAIAPFAGLSLRALAEEKKGRASDVWLLDFAKGTRRLIANVTDCNGVLGEQRHLGPNDRYLVLTCLTPMPPHSVSQTLIWSEIVDLDKKVRLRTNLLSEIVFADGLVVLSSRRALAAESKAAPGEIWSVDP